MKIVVEGYFKKKSFIDFRNTHPFEDSVGRAGDTWSLFIVERIKSSSFK